MASSTPNKGRQPLPEAPLPPQVNNRNSLSHSLHNLSIATPSSTALPPSPRVNSPSRSTQRYSSAASPNGKSLPRSPVRRTSSSTSLDARAATPTLLKKASMNSLRGGAGLPSTQTTPSRRSSTSNFVNSSALVGKPAVPEVEDLEPPKPRHTAESIAKAHFQAELELHDSNNEERATDTVAILHDACYGHRYSRPRTSKASLSTIVERPERIHASILGLSVAYVRLGERHAEGQHPLHPDRAASSLPALPFKVRRTTRRVSLSSQAVTNVHGVKWMEELKIMCDNAEARLAMNGKELTRPEMTRSPDQGVPAKFHEGDLYLCAESLNAMEGALGAVCDGVDAVFQGSNTTKGPHRAFVAIRPPGHHCAASYPSGFCWVNNVHVGISHAALSHGLTHAAIIDFDLHHGDGSQTIAWDQNRKANSAPKNAAQWKKTSIGYFSLHDINSYPCEMGDEEKVKNASLCIENAHGQSIWNVHLLPWKSESEFWELYENKYSILLEKTRSYLRNQTERLRQLPNGPKPRAAIFLSAGFDASEWESSGMQRHKVNVPTEFYARLTKDVVQLAAEEGTGVEGRVISVLEGGYSDRALCTGVLSHISGMVSGSSIITKEADHSGLGYEMGQKIGAFNGTEELKVEPVAPTLQSYDSSWWSLPHLEQLDATLRPTTPPTESAQKRDPTVLTYSSPTQSFIAKVSSPTARRSISSMLNGSPRPISRAPSPPPPDVFWNVAAHELSKLLIPSDRQTMSCRPEDLNAEATRVRRDRQSILTAPVSKSEVPEAPSQRMALRTRKPAKAQVESEEEDAKKAARLNRRKTVAGLGALAADKPIPSVEATDTVPGYGRPTSQSSRRLSLASNTSDTSRTISRAPSVSLTTHRRVSSQSVRPDSSMSTRTPAAPSVVVRKARAPAQPRAEPAKINRVRKKSPLSGGADIVPTKTEASAEKPVNGVQPEATSSTASKSDDIDSLTSGMRKIKINLVTKEQREAKEQAKVSAKPTASRQVKTTTARAPRSKVAAKPANASIAGPKDTIITSKSSETSSDQPAQPSQQFHAAKPIESLSNANSSEILVTNVEPVYGPDSAPQSSMSYQSAIASDSPNLPTAGAFQGTQEVTVPTSSTPDVFIPYQPEGPPPQSHAPQAGLQWLPPNTSTPSSSKWGELPIFTSTGSIPFGLKQEANTPVLPQNVQPIAEVHASGSAKELTKDHDIWEVPETPHKQ